MILKHPSILFLVVFVIAGLWADLPAQSVFPYRFIAPDAIMELDDELNEISGLSLSSDGQHLLAVQDEDGIIFYVNKTTGVIEKKVEFWKEGDYEGIEAAGAEIYVAKSTGTIYRVEDSDGPNQKTLKYNDELTKDNDVEGLAYDPTSNSLLLACKKHPDGQKEVRYIYRFSLASMKIDMKPAYELTLKAILQYLETEPDIMRLAKVKDFFYEEKDDLDFSPSAMAVHPLDGNIYLLSSKGKMIIVLNRHNEVVYIQKLQKEEHPQPEGMCFDSFGNLYISNEARDAKGTILLYRYHNQ